MILYRNIFDFREKLCKNIFGFREKEYKNIYKIKIEKINKNKKYENICLYLSANKKIKLMYGDKIKVKRKL